MRAILLILLAASVPVGFAAGQELEPAAEVAQRVFDGGRFEPSRYRRTDNGVLEFDYFADFGGARDGEPRWIPLCGAQLEFALNSRGKLPLLSLLYHGPDDLVAMTDGAFHLDRIGFNTSNVGLRQQLMQPLPGRTGDGARADLLDRMVAIDVLTHRRCMAARAELKGIAKGDWPAPLRRRARIALRRLGNDARTIERRTLVAERLQLPTTYDACIFVDHARLPPIPASGHRLARGRAESLARQIESAPRQITEAMRNGCQRISDALGELPYATAHQFGNARVDHSALFVHLGPDGRASTAFAWQAAGDFEPERWNDAILPKVLARRWRKASLDVTATTARGSIGQIPDYGIDAERARAVLGENPCAIRMTVPATSAIWSSLAGIPGPAHAVVRADFGQRPVLQARLRTDSESSATRWLQFLNGTRGSCGQLARRHLPAPLCAHPDFGKLIAAVATATLGRDGRDVTISLPLPALDANSVMTMIVRLQY